MSTLSTQYILYGNSSTIVGGMLQLILFSDVKICIFAYFVNHRRYNSRSSIGIVMVMIKVSIIYVPSVYVIMGK